MIETTNEKVRALYELLNIIDNKAAALLTFNALLLAVISVWLGYVPLNFLHFFLDVAFLVLVGSCLFLLWIIWLHWSQPTGEAALEALRLKRTWQYRASWRLAMFGVLVVGAVSVVHTVGTGLKALRFCQSGPCAHFYGPDIFGNLDQKH